MDTLKQKVISYISDLGTSRSAVTNPNRKDNKSGFLFKIFIWQEASKFAEKNLEKAWSEAQMDLIAGDDKLRQNEEGEHIIVESGSLSCVVKVSKPRETFDREMFITMVAKKYKLKVSDLLALADACKNEGKASLQKRVLEA